MDMRDCIVSQDANALPYIHVGGNTRPYNEANVGRPGVTHKVTPGFFVPISNDLHTDGLVAETVIAPA